MAEDGIQWTIPGKPGRSRIPGPNDPCSTMSCDMRRYRDWIISRETTGKIGYYAGAFAGGAACTAAAKAANLPLENKWVAGAIGTCAAVGADAGEKFGKNDLVNEIINDALPTGMVGPPNPPVLK